ncbi:MAG TPA: SH3 domain-containing protein [Bryobacteraceae bacterium]|jgi:hypothetical protein
MHASPRRLIAAAVFAFPILALTGCGTDSPQALGRAYVAPATLNLRGQLAQKNSTVEVLKHGERVNIIDVRRRFVKVRTEKGVTGWVDSLELLSPEEMAQIREEREKALMLPSEGQATPYETLNIHLGTSRKSPAFAQIPDGAPVTVLAHKIAPKVSGPVKPSLNFDRPQPPVRRSRAPRPSSRTSSRLPAPPPPPKPPTNWQELSAERIDGTESTADLKARKDEQAAEKKAEEAKKPAILEDWTLVRTKSNQVGWVLSRNLMMSIPDEVAQYAEGKHITSYFSLGDVNDEEKGLKHNWLWTTSSGALPYDFDGWRVFLWNKRRHRYETSYRQREVEGYFPVHVDALDATAASRTFQLITKDDDGALRRRAYLFDGVRVHLTATENYNPEAASESEAGGIDTAKLQKKASKPGWFARHWEALKQRFSGRGQ